MNALPDNPLFTKQVILGLDLNGLTYSRVPNKRDGWNKCDGRTFLSKSINVMVLINVMIRQFEKLLMYFLLKI